MRGKRILATVLPLFAVFSCSRYDADQTVCGKGIFFSLDTKSLAGDPDRSISSIVLVTEGKGGNALGSPITTCRIADISQWDGRLYDTRKPYPADNSAVYIFGYAPEDFLTADDSRVTLLPDYPESRYDNSIWEDILVAGPLTGRKSQPVDKTLEYYHPVAKFKFYSYKDESMVRYHVRNVCLTIDAASIPYSLRWDGTDGIWKPVSNNHDDIVIVFKGDNDVDILGPGRGNAFVASPFYLIPQEHNAIGPFTISATYYIDGDPSSDKVHTISDIFFQIATDGHGGPVSRINAGEEYAVLICFSQDSFTLSGVRLGGWEDGGNIIIPVINETTDII